ncbi:MAG: MBL fold metallo-hydrolase [Balneola sp.]|nr:MBL fold metallo-hydrolase [Balneola sp.]MBO6649393.1 MBL fold metallo-hydrolase [Balneola sp.]MBO6711208.1 MBL fold metallo-hydrolase [Balneola sp.]MBO6800677.1 MBL fold metallo-hydrolase [Balneola sp.]MBO6869144.1 MBL fold metallo-hydrolase [Balneola sp.]
MKKSLSLLLIFALATISSLAQLSSTADIYDTEKGDLTVHPVNHGTVAFTFDGKTIFVDPYGGADKFADFNAPDLILITDIHGDHLNSETISGLNTANTTFVVPQAVADRMSEGYQNQIVVIGNEESTTQMGIKITGVAMYNLPDDETSRHKKGRGNGYVINFGGTNIYLSGDTEDIPEMRNLENIDIAFVCMNLPYTMDIYQAASAVIEFSPSIMYPYHHRGQDIERFKEIMSVGNPEVNVILKDWYPGN